MLLELFSKKRHMSDAELVAVPVAPNCIIVGCDAPVTATIRVIYRPTAATPVDAPECLAMKLLLCATHHRQLYEYSVAHPKIHPIAEFTVEYTTAEGQEG